MLPAPYGQIPAMARNRVDLPQPDGPATNTRSPACKLAETLLNSGLPFGNCRVKSSSCRSDLSDSHTLMPRGWALTCSMAALNPARRLTQAFQLARSPKTLMNHDSEPCT